MLHYTGTSWLHRAVHYWERPPFCAGSIQEQIHRVVAEPATAMAGNMTWPQASSNKLTSWRHPPPSISLIYFVTSPTEVFYNHKFCTHLLPPATALQGWPIATLKGLHGDPSERDRKVAGRQQGVVLQDGDWAQVQQHSTYRLSNFHEALEHRRKINLNLKLAICIFWERESPVKLYRLSYCKLHVSLLLR